jgi:hypothetical protein
VIAQLETITQLAGGTIQPELQDIQVSDDQTVAVYWTALPQNPSGSSRL